MTEQSIKQRNCNNVITLWGENIKKIPDMLHTTVEKKR